MYDYLIVGAGFFGAVFAHEMKLRGKKCLVIDRRAHIGGNCYTEPIVGITRCICDPTVFRYNLLRAFHIYHCQQA